MPHRCHWRFFNTSLLRPTLIDSVLHGCDHTRRLGTLAVDNWKIQRALVQLKADDDGAAKTKSANSCWEAEGREHAFDESSSQLAKADANGENATERRTQRRAGSWEPQSHLVLAMFKNYRCGRTKYAAGLPTCARDLIHWEDLLELCWSKLRDECDQRSNGKNYLVPYKFDIRNAEHIQLIPTGGDLYSVFKTVFYRPERNYHDPLWSLARGFYTSRNWSALSFAQPESCNSYQLEMEKRRRKYWLKVYRERRSQVSELDSFLIFVTLQNLEWACSSYKWHFLLEAQVTSDKQLKKAPERFEELWIRLMGNVEEICEHRQGSELARTLRRLLDSRQCTHCNSRSHSGQTT